MLEETISEEKSINKEKKQITKNASQRKLYGAILLFAVIVIIVVGLYMLYSSSYAGVGALGSSISQWYFLKRQLISLAVGGFGGFVAYRISRSHKYTSRVLFFAGFVIFLAMLILIFFVGEGVNGSKRWINILGFSLQPSEFLKVFYIVFIVGLLNSRKNVSVKTYFISLIVPAIIAIENLSTALILLASVTILFIYKDLKIRKIILMIIPASFFMVFFILREPYRLKRVTEYLTSIKNPLLASYQAKQSFYAIANGRIFGQGLTNSVQKYYYLPEHHTDFIFAIIIEELGMLTSFVIIFIYGIMLISVFMISKYSENTYEKMVVLGFGSLLTFQVILNLSVVTGLFPVTGVTLPLISYGGSSLIATLFMIGYILGIAFKKES